MGNHPGGIVHEGDQIGLAAHAPFDGDTGAVHDIAGPELSGSGEGEAAAILVMSGLGLALHQPMTHEQAVDRGRWQRQIRVHRAVVTQVPDHLAHGPGGMFLLQGDQGLGDGR